MFDVSAEHGGENPVWSIVSQYQLVLAPGTFDFATLRVRQLLEEVTLAPLITFGRRKTSIGCPNTADNLQKINDEVGNQNS